VVEEREEIEQLIEAREPLEHRVVPSGTDSGQQVDAALS